MALVFIGLAYLKWHYSSAIKNLTQIWSNFVWFIFHFFSLGILARTLFSPWRRLDEKYVGTLALKAWLETFIVNALMRMVGFLIRSFFILSGLIILLAVSALLIPALVFWFLLPPALVVLFVSGLILIFP